MYIETIQQLSQLPVQGVAERLRLRNGDRELKAAVTNVSHDLRTPLTAICGYLDLLEGEEHSADGRRYLAVIRERTEAMRSLTEELFRYSVLTAPEEALLPSPAEETQEAPLFAPPADFSAFSGF